MYTVVKLDIGTKDLQGNPKPQVSLDQTETGQGNILKNIVGLDRDGEFDFRLVQIRVCFTGVWDISWISGINLHIMKNLPFILKLSK